MSDISQLPVAVDFDLDAWQPPADEVKGPFVTRVGGKVITMTDPRDEDWQELLDLQSPVDFLRVCMNVEDRKHIMSLKLPSRKLNALMERFMEHFEIDEQIRQAQRQAAVRGL